MIRTKIAKKVLTKKEQRHLTNAGVHSMKTFLTTRKFHIGQKDIGGMDLCFKCRHIALKLGIES